MESAAWNVDTNILIKTSEALGKIREPAVEILINKLGYPSWLMSLYCCQALGIIKDQRAIEPLVTVLKNEQNNEILRQAAATALKAMGWKE